MQNKSFHAIKRKTGKVYIFYYLYPGDFLCKIWNTLFQILIRIYKFQIWNNFEKQNFRFEIRSEKSFVKL